MKILYHSAPPTAKTGYGVHTRNLVDYLRLDHDINIHSVSNMGGGTVDWDGIPIYPCGAGEHGELSIPYWYEKSDADVVFSHHDHWAMDDTFQQIHKGGIPTMLYTILDHDRPNGKPPEKVVRANEGAHKTIVMSDFAEACMKRSRIDNEQIVKVPHGVDTTKYAPVTDYIPQEELKKEMGIPEDAFLFTMVAANYGPRKNIPNHMEAFKRLADDHDDVYLYVHTHPQMGGGYNLFQIRESLDLDEDRCFFPDQHEMQHGIDDLTVVQFYNTADVHLNATQAESWGLTVTEAMACGTPVIATNYSAMTEQFGEPHDLHVTEDEQFFDTGQGLLVHRGAEIWTQGSLARRFLPKVDDLEAAMRYYYNNQDLLDGHGQNARRWVVNNYSWPTLYEEEWLPLFNQVEEELEEDEYDEFYFRRREAETQSEAFKKESLEIEYEIIGDSVVDVGCGTGALAEWLENRGYDVLGIEYSSAGVEKTEEKDVDVRQGDIRNLNLKDNSFDTAVSQHVIEHIDSDAKALAELARVAEEKVVSVVPGPIAAGLPDETEERRYNTEELERLKEQFGDLTGLTMKYDAFSPSEGINNWLITVNL